MSVIAKLSSPEILISYSASYSPFEFQNAKSQVFSGIIKDASIL